MTLLMFLSYLYIYVVLNCRNKAIDITKNDNFYKHFLICNPKFVLIKQ